MSKYSITIFLSFFVFFGYSQNKKELNATILRLQSDSTLMSNTIRNINKEHTNLSKQYAEAQEQLQKKSNTISSLNSKNKELMSEIKEIRKSQQEQLALLMHRLDSLNKEHIKIKEENSSTVKVDCREVSTTRIDDLVVMNEDLGQMNWEDAKKACADLGDGWILPTLMELLSLASASDDGKIAGFNDGSYWSSEDNAEEIFGDDEYPWSAACIMFEVPNYDTCDKKSELGVRAVRTF